MIGYEKVIKVVLLMIFLSLLFYIGYPVSAQEEESIEDLMSGFEDSGEPAGESTDESNNSQELEELMEGFEDDVQLTDEAPGPSKLFPSLPFSLDGHVKVKGVYNYDHDKPEEDETDWRGLSSLRTELLLELSGKFTNAWRIFVSGKGFYDFAYEINGRNDYTDDVLEEYENEIELREAWVWGRLSDFLDVKVGRQIVVWGRSDNVRITDVINPLDLREPGMTDIEDLRLPLWMTRVDAYYGNWNLTGIAIHEIRFNKLPPLGSDFYPEIIPLSDLESFLSDFGISPSDIIPEENMPQDGGDNTEYAVALEGTFSGWDISFYWANFYNDFYHPDFDAEIAVLPPPLPQLDAEFKHARVNMVGSAFNVTSGNWLFKGEIAYLSGLRYYYVDVDVDVLGVRLDFEADKKYYRLDALVGIEYMGFDNTTISFDIANRYITNYDGSIGLSSAAKEALEAMGISEEEVLDIIGVKENEFQWFLRVSRTFMNETLTLNFLASVYGWKGQGGSVERFWAEYDLTDNIQLTGGIVLYESGDLPNFRNIGKNDRVFVEIKYSF